MMKHDPVWVAVLLFAVAVPRPAWAQDAKPTPPPKCSSVPPKMFPPQPPAATAKQGRFAACMPAKQCGAGEDRAKAALGGSFCAMNYYETCRRATCDKPTLSCQPELRLAETKGVKLSNCISRASAIACPKAGEEICLCDMEIEAKGGLSCGCTCQAAPTPSPAPRK